MNDNAAQEHIELMMVLTRFPKYSVPKEMKIEDHFYNYLNESWSKDLSLFFTFLLKNEDSAHATELKTIVYITAAGLVAFGRKDVIPFLFINVSAVGEIEQLRKILLELLPLPEELRDLRRESEILSWFVEFYDELSWNDTEKVFSIKK